MNARPPGSPHEPLSDPSEFSADGPVPQAGEFTPPPATRPGSMSVPDIGPVAPAVPAPRASGVGSEVLGAPLDERRPPPRALVGFLTVLVPGLGHAAAGRIAAAVLFFLPVLIAGGILVAAALTEGGTPCGRDPGQPDGPRADCWRSRPSCSAGGSLRSGSSLVDPRWPPLRTRDAPLVVVLALLVIVPQVGAGYVTNVARETSGSVFRSTPGRPSGSRRPSPAPTGGTFGVRSRRDRRPRRRPRPRRSRRRSRRSCSGAPPFSCSASIPNRDARRS